MIQKIFKTIRFIIEHPIGRRRPILCLYRYIGFQLSNVLFKPHKRVFSFVDNSVLTVEKGLHSLTGNYYVGLLEFEDMSFLLHFLTEDDNFVDAGSNAGVYTVMASGVKRATSWAYEPIPTTFSRLVENIKLNKIEDRVHALNIGLGDEESQLSFTDNLDSINHIVPKNTTGSSIEVQVKTLDVVLREPIHLLKIDVEGFEMPVLKGAESLLSSQNLKAIIIELNGSGVRYGYNDEDIHKILLNYGFNTFDYEPFKRLLSPIQTYHNEGNTLYLRDIEFIENRVANARSFNILGINI